jgi:heat shock protein HslJ
MKKTNLLILALVLITALAITSCGGIGNSTNLAGTSWKLVSFGTNTSLTAAAPDVPTSLDIGKDGKMSGNVGCNSFSGDYKVNGSQITFGPVVSTLMACPDPVMKQEAAVLKVFSGTANFKVDAGSIVITSEDGLSTVTFEQVGK